MERPKLPLKRYLYTSRRFFLEINMMWCKGGVLRVGSRPTRLPVSCRSYKIPRFKVTQRQRLTCQSRTCACIEKQSCPDIVLKDVYATQQAGEQQIFGEMDQLTGSKCAASPKLTQTAACALVCRLQQNLIYQIPSKPRNGTRHGECTPNVGCRNCFKVRHHIFAITVCVASLSYSLSDNQANLRYSWRSVAVC